MRSASPGKTGSRYRARALPDTAASTHRVAVHAMMRRRSVLGAPRHQTGAATTNTIHGRNASTGVARAPSRVSIDPSRYQVR